MSDETNEAEGGLGKWWVASAALMTVVLIGLIYVLLPFGDDDSPGQPADTQPPLSASEATPAAEGWKDAGCSRTSGSSEIPVSPPEGVAWEPLGAMSVPTSSEYGPLKTDQPPLRQCFQHSPTGALFAAVNVPAASAATGRWRDATAVLREQMTPGSARDAALTDRNDFTPGAWSVAAFRITACDATRCNVDVAFNLNGKFGQWTLSLVWADGDWRLDGNQQLEANPIESVPAGFVAWFPGM